MKPATDADLGSEVAVATETKDRVAVGPQLLVGRRR